MAGPMVNKMQQPGSAMLAAAPGVNAGGSYYPQATQTGYEKSAGVDAPNYLSLLDETGQLKAPFAYDPTQSSAFSQMAGIAQDTSQLSPWAQLQQQQLGEQTLSARDASNTSNLGATNQAIQAAMLAGGGMDSGAVQNSLNQGARAGTMANQNILNQQLQGNLGIAQADAQNKQALLGQVSNAETGALAANAQTGVGDINNQNQFNANRYSQQMSAWGAQKTAEAQAAAANKGSKGK